jgi:hypothetical protein
LRRIAPMISGVLIALHDREVRRRHIGDRRCRRRGGLCAF